VAKFLSGALFVALPLGALLVYFVWTGGIRSIFSSTLWELAVAIVIFGGVAAVIHYFYTMLFFNPFDEGFAGLRWFEIQRRRGRRRDERIREAALANQREASNPVAL
jgi:hypothetical protein